MRKILILLIGVGLIFSYLALAEEQAKAPEKAKHDYVGEKKCKICHTKDGVYPSWAETKHAKAWEALKPEEQKNKECIGCHTTGTDAEGTLLTGVQCEVCHGPGADYKKKSIMEDKELAIANGLIIPDSTTCMNCHNDKVPEQFRPKDGYNFAEMMKTGLHAKPAKEATKEE